MSDRVRVSRSLRRRFLTISALTIASLAMWQGVVFVQTPMKPPVKAGEVVRLTPAEARRAADEARKALPIQLAAGLEVNVWATKHLVADALALDIDANGVAYVGSTPRGSQWLDTRQHPDWIPEIQRLKTTEDLRQFFREKMATSLSAQNTWITDFNKDGVRDYRDLLGVPERIFKIEDTNGDGVADRSTVVFEGFNDDIAADILGGVMIHSSGDVYATIAPDLWRLRDTNGDGILDQKESLSHGYNVHPSFSGHDMSALTQGPDGMIYWKIGEIGMNVVDKTGKRWPHPHTGAVLRANPDGSDFEVFAYGVRNPQEMAFDDYGNLISADNDGDYPGEHERIIYIAEGSDTGWRSTWQFGKFTDPNNNRYNPWTDEGLFKVRFATQPTYITPPVAPFPAGPAGFAYNPGTALDPAWKNHFFATSYVGSPTNARVVAFTMTPKGAGFEASPLKEMLKGVLAPGMKIGPDGAVYLTDWVNGWSPTGEGQVWKLDSVTGKTSPARRAVQTLLRENFRSRLVPGLVQLLRHDDQRVRMKAQFELVRRAEHSALTAAATAAQGGTREDQLSRVHAVWGLGQLLRSGGIAPTALTPFLTDRDPEIRAQAARVLGQARSAAAVAAALVPLVSDANPRVRALATTALGRLGHVAAMPAVVAMLAADNEQDAFLRTAGVSALTSFGDRAALAALATHTSRGVRLAAVVALRRLRDAGVARFLDDADPLVVSEAASAINDEGGIVAAVPDLARVLDRTTTASEPIVRRALSANLRLGDAAAVARVVAYAKRGDIPAALRVEAITILGVWARPSNMDRVDGAWIAPLPQRDASAAAAAVTELAGVLTEASATAAVKTAWLDAAAKLGLMSQSAMILARLKEDSEPAVRVAALRALETLAAPELEAGVRAAMTDRDPSVRTAAVAALPGMPIAPAAKVELLSAVVASGSTAEKQSALGGLGAVPGTAAVDALSRLATDFAAGRIDPALQLDLLEAMQRTKADVLLGRLDELGVGRDLSKLSASHPVALGTGGVPTRGQQVVTQHEAAQCTRCHTVGSAKSEVGPPLTNIASRLTREQLVEALVDPSARIAPGFGSGVSAMPNMNLLLTPRQIRDVVAFLLTLR